MAPASTSPFTLPSLHPLLCHGFHTPHQSRRWKVGTRESKSGKNRKGLISSVGQRWVAWGGNGNEILPVPFYQPFKAHYSGEGKTYKASALEHISVCLRETEKGSGHASVIDSQFRLPLPFCLSLFPLYSLLTYFDRASFPLSISPLPFLFCCHKAMKYDWSGEKYRENCLFVLASANCFGGG